MAPNTPLLLNSEPNTPPRQHWHVLQTGFDQGLQFLSTWRDWQALASRPKRLFFTVVTDQELPSQAALQALPVEASLQAFKDEWLAAWRGMSPGTHRLVLAQGQVHFTVHSGPAERLGRELDVAADQVLVGDEQLTPAWAKPSAHPRYSSTRSRQHLRTRPPLAERRVVVIGAGLSGSALAHSLGTRGWSVTVIDQGTGVGAGASGLPVGLVAPHVSPDDSVLSRITRAGVRATLQRAQGLLTLGRDWDASGVLEHRVEGKRSLPPGEAWPSSAHAWSTPASAAQVAAAGLPPGAPALWHGLAAWVRPQQLVAAQLNTPGVQMLWGQTAARLVRTHDTAQHAHSAPLWQVLDAQGQVLAQAPCVVVASAFHSQALLQSLCAADEKQPVPLNPLRGQVSWGEVRDLSTAQREQLPPFPVNGHGSFISGVPMPSGQAGWLIGSTFERHCQQAPVREEDHAANQQRLCTLLPALGANMHEPFEPSRVQGWAGLRCTLPDRLPALGPVHPQRWPGVWMVSGMGARGISLAVLAGELCAAWLENEPLPLAPSLAKHLMAERFVR